MSEKQGFFAFLKHSIPRTIWAVGIASLLINSATAVVFTGSALYLKTQLGVAVSMIGFIEAFVEAIAYGIRIFSGVISDYFKRRKCLMIIGFIMLTIAKPLLALSKSFTGILISRTVDRIGNGIQASPRDALISDMAPKDIKGACFGLRQSLAVIGSTLGGLFGIIVMKMTKNNFETLFMLATIPAALSVFILILFVKDKHNYIKEKNNRRKIKLNDIKELGKNFWILMIIVATFMLARFSEIFISMYACGKFGLDIAYGTSITIVYNVLTTLVSYPTGKLSDSISRTTLLLIGFITLFFAHLSIGFANGLIMIFIGTILWGIQRGMTEGLITTLVSDYIPKELKGTGFGVYYLVVSASSAIGTIVAGKVSQSYGNEGAAFIVGTIFCTLSVLLLLVFRRFLSSKNDNIKKI